MVFKVTFSLINYLVNPDSLNDKNSGVGNVAKNIVITLVLLIITPYAFDFLYKAQNAILSDNILPQVILGTSDTKSVGQKFQMAEDCEVVEIDDPGQFMALVALRPFYGVNKGASIESIKDEYCNANYTASDMLTESIYNAEDNDMYIIDYSFFMSTVSGVIVLVLMLTIGMDIALRIIKLGFLEIIAPVPIISYVDPKSGKDGIFKKWLKEVIRTWISLFLKLAVLYFAIYIIKVLDDALVNVSNHNYDMWISLFLLIGALMFAKQFTKLIEDIFGIKLDGMSLHPIKKIQEQAMFGKQLTSAPGKIGAAAIGGTVAAAGFAIGRGLKTKDIRQNQRQFNDETRRLQQLRGKMLDTRSVISNLTQAGASEETIQGYRNILNNQKNEFAELNKTRHETAANLAKAKEKYEKATTDEDGNKYFSASFPGLAGTMQTMRGVKEGFSAKDIKGLSGVITAGINAAKVATKRTNDFDKFGYLDRLKDLGTDITGVKNESGTTSIVKEHLKQQKESLRDIESALRAQEVRFGNLPAGMIKMESDDKGKHKYVVASSNSAVWNNNPTISRDSIISEVENWESMREAQRKIEKSNKEYEDVLAINKPK